MLSPEQRAALDYIQRQIVIHAESEAVRTALKMPEATNVAIRYQHYYCVAADAIEQVAALAEQVRVLREALQDMPHNSLACLQSGCFSNPSTGKADITAGHHPSCHWYKKTAALALTLPEAARQAAENAERAELLEWLMQYSESRFSQWMATYKAGNMMGHMTLIEALRAATEREADRG